MAAPSIVLRQLLTERMWRCSQPTVTRQQAGCCIDVLRSVRPACSTSSSRLGHESAESVAVTKLSETRIFTADDVLAFARLTGDINPLHADAAFASSERFSAPVVHGMLYASMFGAIVGVRFPGAVYVSQSLHFRKPVYLGDTITATLALCRSAGGGRLLDFDTQATNQKREVVLDGTARVLLPRTARLRSNK